MFVRRYIATASNPSHGPRLLHVRGQNILLPRSIARYLLGGFGGLQVEVTRNPKMSFFFSDAPLAQKKCVKDKWDDMPVFMGTRRVYPLINCHNSGKLPKKYWILLLKTVMFHCCVSLPERRNIGQRLRSLWKK